MHSTIDSMPAGSGAHFSRLGALRLLVLGGIGLIVVGMIFGDIFAVFVLHQNAARVGAGLEAGAGAALAGDGASVAAHFQDVGSFLENRGTKVDTHVHMIGFGYLALLLAVLQPWIAFSEITKRNLAWLFLVGAALLPLGVFLIHYVGLAYSPLQAIGWASIIADAGGLCVLLVTAVYLTGVYHHFRGAGPGLSSDSLLDSRATSASRLLAGGLILILVGFAHGAYYAASDLYHHEAQDYAILSEMALGAASRDGVQINNALTEYAQLQGDRAVKIAAHAHIIEFGLLAMIMAFFQPYVNLSERWRRRWASTLLAGSVILPVCVLFELRFGLLAGALADFGGLLVVVALLAMWIGIVRHARSLDADAEMTS
jgi:hypothetical protein